MINGRHYKSCIGVVPHKMYRYFQERKIDLEAYIEAWLNDGGEEFEEEHGVLPVECCRTSC